MCSESICADMSWRCMAVQIKHKRKAMLTHISPVVVIITDRTRKSQVRFQFRYIYHIIGKTRLPPTKSEDFITKPSQKVRVYNKKTDNLSIIGLRAPPGARTLDTLIKSQVLYQLS